MDKNVKKVKKRHLNYKRLFIFLLTLVLIFTFFYYLLTLKIRFVEITGTTYLTDKEIMDTANITDYPPIFSLNTLQIASKLKDLPLVDDVKVRVNIWGKVSLNITEAKVLFYNKSHDQVVLSNGLEIPYDSKYLGMPSLLNYVPDDIYNELVTGLAKIDSNILKMISEIEYSPSTSSTGETIDNTRFLLRMNDTNIVYMNTINITQLNKYIEICSAIITSKGTSRGILYLDSSTEENYTFESFGTSEKSEENVSTN